MNRSQTNISAEFETSLLQASVPLTSCLATRDWKDPLTCLRHVESKYGDLRRWVPPDLPVLIVAGTHNRLDQHYASFLMETCRNVRLASIDTGSHNVTVALARCDIVRYCTEQDDVAKTVE